MFDNSTKSLKPAITALYVLTVCAGLSFSVYSVSDQGRARELLIHSDQSVVQVADQVGYANERSFSKAYNRVYDEGPGATWRLKSV